MNAGKTFLLNDFYIMATILWFTGLSGSGKSTLACVLKERLKQLNKTVTIIDGDAVRNTYSRQLGFSRADIRKNNRLIANRVADEAKHFDFVLVPVISPFAEDRAATRKRLGTDYKEIYVACSLPICMERDPKGLYAKAKKGEIQNMIGMDLKTPYEIPADPDYTINTVAQSTDKSVSKLLSWLQLTKKL